MLTKPMTQSEYWSVATTAHNPRYSQGQIEDGQVLIRAIHKSFVDLGKDENNLVFLHIWDSLVKDECLVELENC